MFKITSFILLVLKGSAVGIANVIPGLSGSTVAVAVGEYDKLINSISSLIKKKRINKQSFNFLLIFFASVILSVYLFSGAVYFILKNYFVPFMYLLTGLVLGSIPSILKTNRKFININFYNIVFLLIGILVPFMLTKNQESYNFFYNSLIIFKQSGLTLKICLILFFSGIISGSAMILPGISGSLMLVIFGQYDMVMYLLKNIVIVPLIFLSAGAAAGIFFCSKCVNFLLEKKPSITLFFILGLVIGSCYSIFPGIPKNFISFLKSIFIIFTGIAVSIFLHFVDFKKQT